MENRLRNKQQLDIRVCEVIINIILPPYFIVTRKVILYIATSLDGFIARKDGSVDWLEKYNTPAEDYGYNDFLDSIDTIVMGNTSYQQILSFGEFPYKNKKCFVFANKGTESQYAEFVKGSVETFLGELNPDKNKNMWLLGGANLVRQFIGQDLIDEFIITIVPVIIGGGIQLFSEGGTELSLALKEVKSYKSGVVQIHYERKQTMNK